MKLKKLLSVSKKFKHLRKNYYIKPCVELFVDDCHYEFAILPTIIWIPWVMRQNYGTVVGLHWLNMYVTFGEWRQKNQ